MKKHILLLFLIMLGIVFSKTVVAQSQITYPADVELVLKKARKNRFELEGFLQYCLKSGNSQKWDAGCFLIKNMDIHYSEIYHWVDESGKKINYNEFDYPNFSVAIKALKDLNSKNKLKPIIRKEYDVHMVTSEFLIDNLEKAFDAWKTPQSKHLTFEEFCEYILPYRNVTEKLEKWRGSYLTAFQPSNQSSRSLNVLQATDRLSNALEYYFEGTWAYEDRMCPVSYLSPSQMLYRERGHCQDRVNFAVLAFKAQGIPCRIDMVPHHGTSTGRHYWNATINTDHQVIPFEGSKTTTEKFTLTREPAKVITITYAKQPDVPASIVSQEEIPEGFLRNSNFKDVTDAYWPTKDIICHLQKDYSQKLAYVAVLNGLKWQPVHWGKIENGNIVNYSKMGVGAAYLPMVYINGKLEPADYPVLLFDSKETKILKPQIENTHTITLKEQDKYLKYREGKSYKLFYWNNDWILAGEKKAGKEKYLQFEGIPKEALLLMIPEYSQGKERPFYITSSGERIWW